MEKPKEIEGRTGAFLTGSQVYGSPRVDSDVDLAILVTEKEANILRACADHAWPCRYGNLNLIIFISDDGSDGPERFIAWKKGTNRLISEAPVSRAHAIEVLDAEGARGLYTQDNE